MKFTAGLVGVFALSAVASIVSAADELPPCENCADTMTIVSWGGAYTNSQNEAYHKPYAELTGVEIINDDSSAEAVPKMRAMEEAGNVTWDVVDVTAADAIRSCDEGLAIEIDADTQLAPAPDGTPASEDFGDLIVSDCFIPQIVYSTTFGYRTDVEAWGENTPEDVCAVFDMATFPGQRALQKQPLNNLEWALMCDGVASEDVYDVLETDEGVQQALAKLDTIKDQVVWWSAGAEPPQLLADSEVVIASAFNGRLFSVIEEQKQPVAMLWDAQVFDLDGWVIPEGLSEERRNRALHYIMFATDTQRLADQAKYISYGPARASSTPLVGQHAELGIDMAPHMPNDPANATNTFLTNYEWWADNRDDLDAKFQAWLAQ